MCNEKARLKGGVLYWLLYVPFLFSVPFLVLFVVLLVYAFAFPKTFGDDLVWLFSSPWFFAILIVWLVMFPIDKLFDGRFRELRRLRKENSAV
jgi:hypothetical protein